MTDTQLLDWLISHEATVMHIVPVDVALKPYHVVVTRKGRWTDQGSARAAIKLGMAGEPVPQ